MADKALEYVPSRQSLTEWWWWYPRYTGDRHSTAYSALALM